ncbi:MAG: efflux RND transporter periplasmic adaptor subunit [Gemmatimonadota bacterium]|nr:efflux RND transporter periplasmic adaptor subunit [Gemmatimonadota bacterium]
MKRTRGVLLFSLTAVAAGCGASAEANGTGDVADSTAATVYTRVINVEVMEVARESFVEEIRLTGTATANRDVLVSAEESGVIREVLVEKGRYVAAGTPLARIDDTVLSAQVGQARAQADLAGQTWERRKRLWEEDGVGSEIAYLEARSAAEQTAANLAVLEERLARTVIRAPFGGILEDRRVEVGTLVNPGQAVARIVDLDPVKVSAGVPERYAADLAAGAEARITFAVLDGAEFTAPIRYVGSVVDPSNRTFPVEVQIRNAGALIKPEMVADLSVVRRRTDEALVLPQDALVRVEDGFVVFVVEDAHGESSVVARTVEVAGSQKDRVVVSAGVAVGDRVVVVGQKSVAHGDRVNIVATRR